MAPSEAELVDRLLDAGDQLAAPPANRQQLLSQLDQIESFLSKVKQSPSESMSAALRPAIEAVAAEMLLNLPDMDVKVALASCFAEITRITAPDPPYDNNLMKVVFDFIVNSFKKLNDMSSPLYSKRVKILETVATTCSSIVLLDLGCDALVLEMFQHFLRTIRPSHPEKVFSSMEAIMTLLLDESDNISSELLSCLLSSVKEDCEDVSPMARKLAGKVINNCAVKLRPYLGEVIQSTGTTGSDYGSIVASICQENSIAKVYSEQMVAMELDQKLVGSRIEVWWPNDERFYPGVVSAYLPETREHMITYDDGDTEELLLKDEFWKFVNSSEADQQVQPKDIQRPNESSKRSVAVADPWSNSASDSSEAKTQTTMTTVKTSERRYGSSANCLPQKRPFAESETKTKTDPKTAGAANRSLNLAKTSQGIDSVLVAKETAAKERNTTWKMKTCSSPAVQDLSSAPVPTEPGKFGDSLEEVLDTFGNVSSITRIPAMTEEDKGHMEVELVKQILVNDEEIEDLRAIEAEKRLRREKRRRQVPVTADVVASSLTQQASAGDDVPVDLRKHIFDSAFREKIRVFSEISQNMWYQTNPKPLPNYAELADEFGRDAAFDHGKLFKMIRQTPHYRGLDISQSEVLEDLWYKFPLVFEALHKSFKSQRFLQRNIDIIRGWLTKLSQAGFDISVPSAALDLLTLSPTDFMKFQESLNSVSRQLSEEKQNVEAFKLTRPISKQAAILDSKIENLKQQVRDLESKRMSLEPLKSAELELEKYGTSLKACRLQKLKDLYEKELAEAKQFLRDVSLDGWYEHTEVASSTQ